jgi:hypothetical protein
MPVDGRLNRRRELKKIPPNDITRRESSEFSRAQHRQSALRATSSL